MIAKLFNKQPRLTTHHIKVEDLHSLRNKLQSESKYDWETILKFNVQRSITKEQKNHLKRLYHRVIQSESTLIKIKNILQQINLGVELLGEVNVNQALFPEIFKLAELKVRRGYLIRVETMTQQQKEDKYQEVFSRKFINKELNRVQKLIDKTQYKIDQANKKLTINIEDLGLDIAYAYERLLAA